MFREPEEGYGPGLRYKLFSKILKELFKIDPSNYICIVINPERGIILFIRNY